MGVLYNLKTLRLLYSILSPTFLSKSQIFSVGSLKPFSHFALQNHVLNSHFTSSQTSPENQQPSTFTVNYLISSCGLSPEGAISASKWVHLQSHERPDAVLGFLKNHGFSETQISKLVRSRPQLLLSNPEKTLLPKLEFFVSLGVSQDDVAKTLASNPKLLSVSLGRRIVPTYNFLSTIIPEKNFVAVIKRGSQIFLEGQSKNVAPNIGVLRELGMPQSQIFLLLAHGTRALMQKPQKFVQVVNEVKQTGFNLEKSTFVMAIIVWCGKNSKSIWNRNRQVYLTRWGWSEDHVLSAFRKFPGCMFNSDKRIMQVMEFLVDRMGWPSRKIAGYPVVIGLSLEKRIIPRCSVVKVLLLKGLVLDIENVSLSLVLKSLEEKFLESFVTRYLDQVPQLASVYQGNVGIQDV